MNEIYFPPLSNLVVYLLREQGPTSLLSSIKNMFLKIVTHYPYMVLPSAMLHKLLSKEALLNNKE